MYFDGYFGSWFLANWADKIITTSLSDVSHSHTCKGLHFLSYGLLIQFVVQ